MARHPSEGAARPVRTRSHAAAKPKMNPPTWAKNATPPPFAWALNSPKFASMSWYKNHAPRKIQAGIRTRKTGKIHVRTCERHRGLHHHRGEPADEVEHEVGQPAEGVLDVLAEDGQSFREAQRPVLS
jgi:hypothetical protein